MVTVSVQADVKGATRWLNSVQRRQIPFATSKALNDTAFEARKNLQKGIARDLDRPTPFTQKGFRVHRAKKSRLEAIVEIEQKRWEYLKFQVEGGTRRPKSRVIIIGQGRRNQYGNTPGFRRLRSRLLAQKTTFEGTINGTAGIWRRHRNGRLELLARYVNQASYQRRFRFRERVEKTVRARFPTHFARSLQRALATAR